MTTDSSVSKDSSSDTQIPDHPAGTKGSRVSFAFAVADKGTADNIGEDNRGAVAAFLSAPG